MQYFLDFDISLLILSLLQKESASFFLIVRMPEIHRDLLRCVRCDQDGDTIKKCAKCLSVSYCGRECQVANWARHKRLCLPVLIKEMGEKGRGLVASRDFKVGDLIFNDKLVVSIKKSPAAMC